MTSTTRSIPARRRARKARGLSGRTGSCRIRAPATSPSTATNTLEEPSSAVRRRTRRMPAESTPSCWRKESLPMAIRRPSTSPWIPWPGRSVTFSGKESGSPRSRAARTTAAASTCWDIWSREAARRRISGTASRPKVSTSEREGIPGAWPPESIRAITAPARYSPRASDPAIARRAMRSTPSSRRHRSLATVSASGTRTMAVVTAHRISERLPAPASRARPPARMPARAIPARRRPGFGMGTVMLIPWQESRRRRSSSPRLPGVLDALPRAAR